MKQSYISWDCEACNCKLFSFKFSISLFFFSSSLHICCNCLESTVCSIVDNIAFTSESSSFAKTDDILLRNNHIILSTYKKSLNVVNTTFF